DLLSFPTRRSSDLEADDRHPFHRGHVLERDLAGAAGLLDRFSPLGPFDVDHPAVEGHRAVACRGGQRHPRIIENVLVTRAWWYLLDAERRTDLVGEVLGGARGVLVDGEPVRVGVVGQLSTGHLEERVRPVAQPQTQAAGLTPRLVGDAGDRRQRDHALAQSPSQRVDLAIAAWNDAHQLTVERPTAVAHDDLGHSRIVVIAAGNMTGHPKLGCCRWAIFTPHAPALDRKSTRLNSSHAKTSYA